MFLELAVNNKESKNYLDDNVYYGISLYYANANKKDGAPDAITLAKAEGAFDKFETTNLWWSILYTKGRINNLLEKDDLVSKITKYVTKTTAKGPEELTNLLQLKK